MKNKIYAFFLIFFFVGVIFMMIKGNNARSDLTKNGKLTIGKYVLHKRYSKSSENYFIFYLNGEICKRNGGTAPSGFSKNIGKFYKIKYLEKYNIIIDALFNEQITDTLEILKAGFSMDEVLNIKRNNLFPPYQKME